MHWPHEQVRLFLLLSVILQRLFYDQFLVWLLPQSMREISALVLCSWLGYFGFYLTGRAAETWVIETLFLPALLIVMHRSVIAERQAAAAGPGTQIFLGPTPHE